PERRPVDRHGSQAGIDHGQAVENCGLALAFPPAGTGGGEVIAGRRGEDAIDRLAEMLDQPPVLPALKIHTENAITSLFIGAAPVPGEIAERQDQIHQHSHRSSTGSSATVAIPSEYRILMPSSVSMVCSPASPSTRRNRPLSRPMPNQPRARRNVHAWR